MEGVSEGEAKKFLLNLVSIVAKIGGGSMGLAAATITGVPEAGLIVSPFVGFQLEKAGKHLIESRIAPREEMRVAAAYVLAYSKIAAMQAEGAQPRADGFFNVDTSNRSAAEEITEATLAAARDAAEERKVPFIANLLASVVFDTNIDRSTAHFLIGTAERISYRSFAIVALVGSGMPQLDIGVSALSRTTVDAILSEAYSLISAGFLASKQSNSMFLEAVLSPDNIDPQNLHLTDLGQLFYGSMSLESLNGGDSARRDVEECFRYAIDRPGLAIDGGTA